MSSDSPQFFLKSQSASHFCCEYLKSDICSFRHTKARVNHHQTSQIYPHPRTLTMADSDETAADRSRGDLQSRTRSRSRPASPPGLTRFLSGGAHLDDHGQYHGHRYHEKEEEPVDESSSTEDDLEEEAEAVNLEEAHTGDIVPEAIMGIQTERDIEKVAGDRLEKSRTSRSRKSARDPNLVDWEGPDDPENPKNWKLSRKWAATFVGKWEFLVFFTLIC